MKKNKKQEILNELKELKKMIEYMEAMTEENENYKPLDKAELELLEKKQTSNCIRDAHLYIISEKIKKLVELNKKQFKTNFKTIISRDKITIGCIEDLKPFNAITLNTNVEPPQIESTIYDLESLAQDKINAEIKLKKLLEIKKDLTEQVRHEEINLEKMKNNEELFIATEVIEKQEIKIKTIKDEIKEIDERIYDNEQIIIKVEEIEKLSEKMDFDDFEKLRKILEETLGINTTKTQNPVIEQIKPTSRAKIYTIGKKYSVKYIKKTKKLN